uniref:Protein kinase domain-containing protein n=1 Tax=Aegilops tauschii subsp. strangulata TaxID=200361 RepID=A0A453JXG6_AEGTS
MYPEATVNQSLLLLNLRRPAARFALNRYHFWRPASFYKIYRYPFDSYDRIWQSYGDIAAWTNITTTANVDVSKASSFDAPPVVLRSAATPVNGTRLEFSWSPDTSQNNDSSSAAYLLLLYFAELQQLPGNVLRRFDILVDGASWNGSRSYTPKYLSAEVVEQVVVQGSGQHTVSLVATPDAILPPILNAFEIYSLRQMTELATNNGDAKAMMGIRTTYMLKKNWMGDPCAPKAFAWNGLNCSYSSSGPAWITALILSSSLLTGAVDPSFGDLKSLQYLDLSSNKLSGSIPAALVRKRQNGSLVLMIGNNANICDNGASTCAPNDKQKNRTLIIAIAVPIAVATLLFVAAIIILHRRRIKQDTWMANSARLNSPRDRERSNLFENRQFSYKELKLITANFKEEIGRGGFGAVFLGYLENGSPVAVKIRSKTSSQGDREFLSEAQHLSRVHHRNLVSLIGYCKDKKQLALVYEYMHGGDLEDRLRGLEYLHKSCQPPLIHRDVFADEFMTHITTQPAGTLGYLDPEYYNTSRLSEKSDVYSFGVVLLELITGQSPAVAITDTESIHIAQWVRQKLSEGNIESIADSKMGREYDVNSVWKVTELALQCKEQPSRERPTMTDVVAELKECLELEVSRGMGNYNSVTSGTSNLSATSTDSHNDAQANDLKQQSVLELGQVGDASPTHIGPAPR